MTTRVLDVPGGRLFVVDEGSGPPIVLLHAGIGDQRSWNDMVPLLNAAGYRTIRYDQRGAGQTTTEDVAFSRIDDLLDVLDASGITRAVLVGNSMGGQLAFDTAIEHPDRVVAEIDARVWVDGPGQPSTRVPAAIRDLVLEMDFSGIPRNPRASQSGSTHPRASDSRSCGARSSRWPARSTCPRSR